MTRAAEVRARAASGALSGPTTGLAKGFAQANLVVLPAAAADDFESYCGHNPSPCPLLERLLPGDPVPRRSAPDADLRHDVPRYRRYRADGSMTEHLDIESLWSADAVAFLLGCSFTFEEALAAAGLVPRHWEEGRNVPMYRTTRQTTPTGPFGGPLVVSMRPIAGASVATAYSVTGSYRQAHGAPVDHGFDNRLGIADLANPEWGDPVTIRSGELPVFWACGVTSHEAVLSALRAGAIEWAITHAPGHMFITDRPTASETS